MTEQLRLAALFNDIIAAAGETVRDMGLSEHWEGSLIGQLNATLYTLAYALPPGLIPIQTNDGDIRVTQSKVETPDSEGQA